MSPAVSGPPFPGSPIPRVCHSQGPTAYRGRGGGGGGSRGGAPEQSRSWLPSVTAPPLYPSFNGTSYPAAECGAMNGQHTTGSLLPGTNTRQSTSCDTSWIQSPASILITLKRCGRRVRPRWNVTTGCPDIFCLGSSTNTCGELVILAQTLWMTLWMKYWMSFAVTILSEYCKYCKYYVPHYEYCKYCKHYVPH